MKLYQWAALAVAIVGSSCTDHSVNMNQYKLDATQSVAEWKGFLRSGYFNEGTIAVTSESLEVVDGKVIRGKFIIPVSSIINLNLPTDEVKAQLVHHLQSADFFHMAVHPNVTFTITDVKPYQPTGTEEIQGLNYEVTGNMTLLGKTNPVTFPAKIALNATSISVEGKAKFDRTLWGMNYATDPAAGDDSYIEPFIHVHLKLKGSKQ